MAQTLKIPEEVACPEVSRVDIAWVCVATNDGHPLHLDHKFAVAAGFKDVVVPAHLIIGWIGQYLAEWCGDQRDIVTWKIRFTAPVWPGDKIKLKGEFADEESDGALCAVKVTAVTTDEKVVGIATAKLRVKA